MNAKVFALNSEVREAALDARAVERRLLASGSRAYEWYPARAKARERMIALSLAHGANAKRPSEQAPLRVRKPLTLAKG